MQVHLKSLDYVDHYCCMSLMFVVLFSLLPILYKILKHQVSEMLVTIGDLIGSLRTDIFSGSNNVCLNTILNIL